MEEKQMENLQERIKALLKKPVIKRALRTFFQAFIGYISVALVGAVSGIDSWDTAKMALSGMIVSAIAAGIAAVMNRNELTTEEIISQVVSENVGSETTIRSIETVETASSKSQDGGEDNA